jgi:hypothetical protein
MITLTREEAQQVLDALEVAPFISNGDDVAYHDKAIQTLRARLAEPEKEQEPVAWFVDDEKGFELSGVEIPEWKPLYAAPPQREWQGLTDEERSEIFDSMPGGIMGFLRTWGWLPFTKAIEQALKEKNT